MIDGIEIVVIRLSAEPSAVRALTDLLSDAERERAAWFVFDRDRRRFIIARARLRELLGDRLGRPAASVEFVYGPHGKPAIAPEMADPALRFNVSHADDLAVYALSLDREIGVDVEVLRTLPDADDIAGRFFSRHEHEIYRSLPDHDKPQGFFNCWTRKEAFIKALGEGLTYPLDRFDVSLAPGEPAAILRVAGLDGDRCGWSLHSFSPAPGFVAAVVVATDRALDHSRCR